MKIGQRANGTSKAQLKKLAEVGFACVDYQDFIYVEKPIMQLSNEEFEAEMCAEREYIESLGLQVGQAHGPWRFPPQDSDANMRAEWLQYCKKAIWGTYLLGCKNMVIHPLMPTGRVDEDPALTKSLNVEFLKALCEEGAKYGVMICLENMPFGGQVYARVAPMLELIKELNLPNLRVCLDTGHANRLGDSPAEAVRMIGKEYLAVLHVHDNDGTTDSHSEPGRGNIDWKDFVVALREIGYEGSFSIESNTPKDITDEEKINYQKTISDIARRLISED